MSKISHKSLRLAALAASLAAALALQPAMAQDAKTIPPAGKAPEHCTHMDGHGDPAVHLQNKLDDLGQKLHLKDNQQAAWKQYRTQLTDAAAAHHKDMEGMKDKRAEFKDLPAPERLQKMADRMHQHADQLDKLAKQTATFYKTLTPEQQTIFDLSQRDLHPKHGHMMMRHH